jgi:hypothetical protein
MNIHCGAPPRVSGAFLSERLLFRSFEPLTLEAKQIYDRHSGRLDAHLPANVFFQDLYAWNFTSRNRFKILDKYMFIIAKDEWYGEYVARPLLGPMKDASFQSAADEVYDSFARAGYPCVFGDISLAMLPAYLSLEGYSVYVSYDLDRSEYVFTREDFAESTRKPSAREAINYLKRRREPTVRPISALPDMEDLVRFTEECFCGWRPCEECSYGCDIVVLRRIMGAFDALGLSGAAIEADGELLGFAIACVERDTLFCIYQKVRRGVRGLNELLRHALVGMCGEAYSSVNYSDDMGIEGLRSYKSRLGPHKLEHVYRVELRRDEKR